MKKSIKQQIEELPPIQKDMFPQINVEPEINIEPIIEVNTPAADMKPIAAAIRQIKQDVSVNVDKPIKSEVHFERDQRGFLKSPITIDYIYDN